MTVRVKEIYAFICDREGEGIVTFQTDAGVMSAVASQPKTLAMMKPFVEVFAKETGEPIKLCKYKLDSVEDLVVLKDAGKNRPGAEEIHYWRCGYNPTNFNSMLLTMLQKSDSWNRAKIKSMWPDLYNAWEEWNECKSQDEYFERYGLPTIRKDDEIQSKC